MRKPVILFVLSLILLFLVAARAEAEPSMVGDGLPEVSGELEAPEGSLLSGVFALHLYVVADLPVDYGVKVWAAALEVGVHPYDLAATLISEHSGTAADFSLYSSAGYESTFDYEPEAEGRHSGDAEKERGLFQLKPNWVYKAGAYFGEDWTKDDLFKPSVNIRSGAFVLKENQESHKGCRAEARKRGLTDTLHSWTAHWKCGSSSRDDLKGRCRFAQRKWDKLRGSLVSVLPVDMKALGRKHNKRIVGILKALKSKNKSHLRGQIRKLCKAHDVPISKRLKKMSLHELQEELYWIEEATGGVESAEGGQ